MRILALDGTYLNAALRDLGHEVLAVGQEPACDVPLTSPLSAGGLHDLLRSRDFRPDAALWCDTCRPPQIFGLETLPCPILGYSIDQYCNPWHVPYSALFDHVLLAQKNFLPVFDRPDLLRDMEWAPLFCDPLVDRPGSGERDIPVAFVGTLDPPLNPGRKPFLEGFRRLHPLVHLTGNYVPVFGQSRLVLNQSCVGELNFRVFQAMACGAAVLTEATDNGLDELFAVGAEVLTYPRGDVAAAAAAARQALDDPNLPRMAEAGRTAALSRHSTTARALRVLELARSLQERRAGMRRREHTALVHRELGMAYAMLASDPALPLPPDYRDLLARGAGELRLA